MKLVSSRLRTSGMSPGCASSSSPWVGWQIGKPEKPLGHFQPVGTGLLLVTLFFNFTTFQNVLDERQFGASKAFN